MCKLCVNQFVVAALAEERVFFTLCEDKMTSRKQIQCSSNRSANNGRSKEDCNFNETDRSILYEINNSKKEMKSEMLALKLDLNETKLELSHVNAKTKN